MTFFFTLTSLKFSLFYIVEFYEEVWFYAVAAVGGLLLVAIAIATVFVCVCCCCKCAKADGKYYSKKNYIIIKQLAESLTIIYSLPTSFSQ